MSWAIHAVGDLCEPTGQCDPRQQPAASFRYIDISSIDRERKTIVNVVEIIGEHAPSRARKEVHHEDILVSTVRPNLNAVAIVPEKLDGGIASTGFCVLRARKSLLFPKFLFYYCQTQRLIEFLMARVRGAHYPAVSDSDVKECPVPLPSPSEQRRIVDILDQADALRKLRSEACTKADRILPALFIKMFGDPATNPKGWETSEFGDVILEGPQNGLYKPSSAYGSGTKILRIDSFYAGRVTGLPFLRRLRLDETEMARYRLAADDIVINRVNSEEYLGKSALIPQLDEPVVFESNMMRLRVNCEFVHPSFVIAHLQTPVTRRQMLRRAKRAINQASINQEDVKSLMILRPPLSLQNRFVHAASRLDANFTASAQQTQQINLLFSILIQRAFAGDLTASWRESHMKELLHEMEQQARLLHEASAPEMLA